MNNHYDPEIKLKALAGKKLLLMGMGHSLRGDDQAGLELARRLIARGKEGVIEATDVPENHIGPVRAYNPEAILLADAAYFLLPRGPWDLLNRRELLEVPTSTHNISPSVVMEFLEEETGAEVLLLGISAENRDWGSGISPRVEQTLADLEEMLHSLMPGPLETD